MIAPLLLALALLVQPAEDPDPLRNLRRGVNLSHWYAQSFDGGYDEEHLSTYFTQGDAAKVADMGFDHVRLTLNDRVLFDPATPGTLKPEPLKAFRGRVEMLLDAGLAVVVDLHPDAPFKEALHGEAEQATLAMNWSALAGALADLPADTLVFEVMNEPSDPWPAEAWVPVQGALVAAIRDAAPGHRVIVSGGTWTNAGTLPKIEPYPHDDIVYTFHYYSPFLYTHQAANWGGAAAEGSVGVPWPAAPDQADAVAAAAGTTPEAAGALRHNIAGGGHDTPAMVAQFDHIKAWQTKHGGPRAVPVYLGEFGVYTKAGDPADRVAWYRFVREQAERCGFGWAIWDYSGGFGVVRGDDREPDQDLLAALGLSGNDDAPATLPSP